MHNLTTKPGFDRYSLISFILSHFEGEQLPMAEEEKILAIPGKEAPKGWADGMVDPRAEAYCWEIAIRLKNPPPLTKIASTLRECLAEVNWRTNLGGEGVSSDPNWEDGILAIPELFGIQAMNISLFIHKGKGHNDLYICINPICC